MEEDLKKLYDAVSSKHNIGEYDAFVNNMKTPEQRRSFYDAVSNKGVNLGDYGAYEERLKKKDVPSVPTSNGLNISSPTKSKSQSINNILESNKDKNFVQRILDPTTIDPLDRGDGVTSTHSMMWGEGDGKYYVYPSVVERDGKLVDLKDAGEDPFKYAIDNNEFIQFDTPEEAESFSNDQGYKQYWYKKGFLEQPSQEEPKISSTRVDVSKRPLGIEAQGEFGKKYGLPPDLKSMLPSELPEFDSDGNIVDDIEPSSSAKLQEWAKLDYEDKDESQAAIAASVQNRSEYKQAYQELQGYLPQGEPSILQNLAQKSDFANAGFTFLRGVNEGVAGTLRALDGAERAFYDGVTAGAVKGGGWFGKAADFMESSLEQNWPEADKSTIGGRLLYDMGHLMPFFGEMMITPSFSVGAFEVGKLPILLSTKGFAATYADADVRKEMGEQAQPFKEAIAAGAMGLRDGLAFELLGFSSGKLGGVMGNALKSTDVAAGAQIVTNSLGFGGYTAIDQLLQNGELNWEEIQAAMALGAGLGMPGIVQHYATRAMNSYYGVSDVNLTRATQSKKHISKLRNDAFDLRKKAEKATTRDDWMKNMALAKATDRVAEIKAGELIAVRDPETTIKSIKENKNLSEDQKARMIQRVQTSVLNAEVDNMQAEQAVEGTKEGTSKVISTETGKVSTEGEKPDGVAETKPKQETKPKTKQDEPIQERKAEEVDVRKQTKDGKEVVEGGKEKSVTKEKTKEVEPKVSDVEKIEKKGETMAASVNKGLSSISQKIEGLTGSGVGVAEIKKDINTFLKENAKEIKEADITSGEIRSLVNARTLRQAEKAIDKIKKKVDQTTKKRRSDALVGYIKENKGNFDGVSNRVHDSMTKKAAQVSLSDAKFRQAVKYINKVLNDADFRQKENKRMSDIDKIKKEASEGKILERKGKRARAKVSYLSREGRGDSINELMKEVSSLVETGKSKKYPKPLDQLEKNQNELERIRKKETQTEADLVEMERLLNENMLLEFSALETIDVRRVEQKLKDLRDIRKGQRTTIAEERANRREALIKRDTRVNEILGGGDKLPKAELAEGDRYKKQKNTIAIFDEMSWPSLMAELARKDLKLAENPLPLYKDRLNEIFTPMILDATKSSENLTYQYIKETNDAFERILSVKANKYGTTSAEFKNKITDMSAKKDGVVEIFNADGSSAGRVALSQMTAAEKWLQLRDPDAIESLFLPADKKGNGFTQATVKELEAFMKPETKEIAEFMYENMKKYSDILDEAYIRENGVSMKNANEDYWPIIKEMISAKGQEGLDKAKGNYPTISNDRTIRRTKDRSLISYTSAYDTYRNYIGDAIHYSSWAEPVRELAYTFKNPEVRAHIKEFHGTKPMSIVDDWMKDFSGDLQRNTWELMGLSIDKTMDNIIGGVLGFKARPMIKQMLSSIYFGLEMPSVRLATGMAGMLSKSSPKWRSMDTFLNMQSFVINRNSQSIVTGNDIDASSLKMLTYGARPEWEKTKSTLSAPLEALKHVGMAPLRFGDQLPIVKAGGAYVDYRYEVYSGKKLTNDVLKEAIDGKVDPHLEKAVYDWDMLSMLTQQSQRQMNVSMFRKKSTPGRLATVLTSGPMQIHRLFYNYSRDAVKDMQAGRYKSMYGNMQKAFVTHAISGILFQLAQQNFSPESKKDWKRLGASALYGNLEAIALIGKGAAWMKAVIAKEWWEVEGIQPVTILNEVNKITKSAVEMTRELSGSMPDWNSIEDEGKKLAGHMSKLLGLPVEGALNIAEGWQQVIEGTSRETAADLFGMGKYDESQAMYSQHGESYSQAVDEMGRNMRFKDDAFEMSIEHIVKESIRLKSIDIDPIAVIEIAFYDEVRKRFRHEYGNPNKIKDITHIFETKANQLSPNDIKKIDGILKKLAEQNNDTEYLTGVMDKLTEIITKVQDETVKEYNKTK